MCHCHVIDIKTLFYLASSCHLVGSFSVNLIYLLDSGNMCKSVYLQAVFLFIFFSRQDVYCAADTRQQPTDAGGAGRLRLLKTVLTHYFGA